MQKIKLEGEQLRRLLIDGECSMVGMTYEVSQVSGLFVRFYEDGVLRVVDAPKKRPIGRPRRVVIMSKANKGLFIDKVGRFMVGQVVDVADKDGRKVEILKSVCKKVSDITDKEWHEMGCYWPSESMANDCKGMYLTPNGCSWRDEVGLYWYKEVSVE